MILEFAGVTLEAGGGKAVGLGELARAGFDVPEGFVVPAQAYRDATADLDLSGGWESVRERVESRPLPAEIETEVADRLSTWGDAPVAVRSSATAEDLPDASFAGQQETYLGVVGTEAVCAAIRRCWGSMWTPRSVSYRERNGFDHAEVAVAVVVQRLIDADVAGVLFTHDPVTGAAEPLIDASWGLGESVVSGAVTPDEFRVVDDAVAERTVGTKETRIDRVGDHTVTTDVPDVDRARPCFDDRHVLQLASLGARVAESFGRPMDVEWALADGHVWLLQARPITTLGREGAECPAAEVAPPTRTVGGHRIGRLSSMFRHDLVEHYPGPAPLDVAAITRVHRELQRAMATLGVQSTPIEHLLHVDDDEIVRVAYPDVRISPRLVRLATHRGADPAGWPRTEARLRERLDALRRTPEALATLDAAGLIAHLGRVLDLVDEIARIRFLDYVGPAQVTGAVAGVFLRLAGIRGVDQYDLLADLPYKTAQVDAALRALAALDPADPSFDAARRAFLAEHGARTTKLYLPFSHRSWREDPAALDSTLDALRRADGAARTTGVAGTALADRAETALPRFLRRRFRSVVQAWRDGHIAREGSVYLIEEGYVVARTKRHGVSWPQEPWMDSMTFASSRWTR